MRAVTPPSPVRVTVVLGVALVAVSLAALFVRLADAPGVVVAFWRMAIACLILLPWTLRALRRTPLGAGSGWASVAAGVLLGVHFATWISSLSYTSVAASVTLVSTIPLWVAVLAWLFMRQPPTLAALLGILVAVAGGAVIAFGDLGSAPNGAESSLFGNALAIIGAISAAGYLLLGRSAQRHGLSLQAYVGVAYGVAALVLAPLPLLFSLSYTEYPLATGAWIVLLALVPQLIGHTGINYALKHLDPTKVATATLLEPVGAGLGAWLLFAELPGALTLAGAALVLLGVLLTTRARAISP